MPATAIGSEQELRPLRRSPNERATSDCESARALDGSASHESSADGDLLLQQPGRTTEEECWRTLLFVGFLAALVTLIWRSHLASHLYAASCKLSIHHRMHAYFCMHMQVHHICLSSSCLSSSWKRCPRHMLFYRLSTSYQGTSAACTTACMTFDD